MSIPIGYINALMSHTICDSYCREAHIDQQTDMAMSDSVDSYSLHSAGSTATAYFMVKVGFCERKNAISFIEPQRFYISLHFIRVEVRH